MGELKSFPIYVFQEHYDIQRPYFLHMLYLSGLNPHRDLLSCFALCIDCSASPVCIQASLETHVSSIVTD